MLGITAAATAIPTTKEIELARSLAGSENLCLDAGVTAIRFSSPDVEINLGSIGRRYALNCMAEQLRGDVRTALVGAGSSSLRAVADFNVLPANGSAAGVQ